MGIQARNVVRAARRLGIKMRRYNPYKCGIGVLGKMYDVPYDDLILSDFRQQLAQKTGTTAEDIRSFEWGFEGWKDDPSLANNPYYKVGKNTYRIAKQTGTLA